METNLKQMNDRELNEWLEEQTFRNIVHFRQDQLWRIIEGEQARDVIPKPGTRANLTRDGVLRSYHAFMGRKYEVTMKARAVLEELNAER